MKHTIFLVGFMGAGKTTVGRKLAEELSCAFYDLDELIEKKTKQSISHIFEEKGEERFRIMESETLKSINIKKHQVIATGGGTAMYEDNMQWMNDSGFTVYLMLHPGILFHRLAKEKKHRPLIANLDDVDLFEFIVEKLKKRLLFYNQAKLILNGDKKPDLLIEEIKNSILHK
jgi:shikimate kinase